jgi:hypothetical protein
LGCGWRCRPQKEKEKGEYALALHRNPLAGIAEALLASEGTIEVLGNARKVTKVIARFEGEVGPMACP